MQRGIRAEAASVRSCLDCWRISVERLRSSIDCATNADVSLPHDKVKPIAFLSIAHDPLPAWQKKRLRQDKVPGGLDQRRASFGKLRVRVCFCATKIFPHPGLVEGRRVVLRA